MKVFLSWSGETSRAVAEALREWLPNVIQAVDPWMSNEDIQKGLNWSSEIDAQLAETRFGIICLTPENLKAPWIMFEAGALSKKVDKAIVCPFLFRVDWLDVKGPLAQFQPTEAKKEDIRKLVSTVNGALGADALSGDKLEKAFDQWWTKLEDALARVPATSGKPQPKRDVGDIVEEILEIVRSEARDSRSLSKMRDDSVSDAVALLRGSLGELPNAPSELRRALRLLRPVVSSGSYRRRNHKPEGKLVSARAMSLSDGRWRAEVFEPKGEDRLLDLFFDCSTKEIAETTADHLVQEGYPHSCREEQCGLWGSVVVRARQKPSAPESIEIKSESLGLPSRMVNSGE